MSRTHLEISRELAAMAQAGLAYTRDDYDRERFERLREIADELIHAAPEYAAFSWTMESGYMTPKVDVRALVIRGEEILMVRERSSGKWSLPGGWADVNLTPAENVVKECREEAGVTISVDRLVSVIDRDRAGYPPIEWSVYKLYFLCSPVEANAVPVAGSEVLEARYFSEHALPTDLDSGRVSRNDIERGFEHRAQPNLPVYFQRPGTT